MRTTWLRLGGSLLWLLGLSVAGCAGPGGVGGWTSPGVEVRSTGLEEEPDPACTTLARAGALSREEAEDLLPDAVAAFRAERSPESRLWALLLLVKAEPREFGDAWALEILKASRTGAASAGRQEEVESLLGDIFAQRLRRTSALRSAETGWQREREAARDLEMSLEEARAGLQAERERIELLRRERDEAAEKAKALGARFEAERGRAADLEAQVEQLKAIEKLLERRESPAPVEGAR